MSRGADDGADAQDDDVGCILMTYELATLNTLFTASSLIAY